jgi:hypothetical protein
MPQPAVGVEELASQLRHRIEVDGGFTLDMWVGHPLVHGIAVCADPTRSICVGLSSWDPLEVAGWLRACRRVGHGREDLFVGGWHQSGCDDVHLDLVHCLPVDRWSTARAIAARHRQRAMFDLAKGLLVPIGAPG